MVWWIATILLTLLILFPILQKTNRYPFTTINVIYTFTFVTIFRYVFFFKYTLIARKQYLKLTLIFLSIPFIFNLVSNLNYFITYLDEFSSESFLGHLSPDSRSNLETYIRSEMLLFGVGSIVAAILFPFRLLVSIWRQKNRGTV
ncbi:MAG: hypothetical protein HKN76_08935 [Saprospiraceae bacterium]|nr:hypothetical protein [Saprospiraceae bacterium]